jgi:hypothetical protein
MVTFSPTTLPIEPPMKRNSKVPATIGRPLRRPVAKMKASGSSALF